MPYLIDKLFGPLAATIIACVCLVGGVGLLIAGHLHRDADIVSRSAKPSLVRFAVLGVLIIGASAALSVVAWKFIQSRTAREMWESPQHTTQLPRPITSDNLEPSIKRPEIHARCSLPKDLSACEIRCEVSNTGNLADRNVSIGFQAMFPAGTRVAADPDAQISLKRADSLPLPDAAGAFPDVRAFTLQIPIVPPKATFRYTLWTASADNQKACRQLTRISAIQRQIMHDFYEAVKENRVAEPASLPQIDLVLSAWAKKNSLFVPGMVTSEFGRRQVDFLKANEGMALDSYVNIDKKLASKVPRVFQGRPDCVGPVFTLEQTNGEPLYLMRLTPYVSLLSAPVKIPEIPKGGLKLEMNTMPPKEYYCTQN